MKPTTDEFADALRWWFDRCADPVDREVFKKECQVKFMALLRRHDEAPPPDRYTVEPSDKSWDIRDRHLGITVSIGWLNERNAQDVCASLNKKSLNPDVSKR